MQKNINYKSVEYPRFSIKLCLTCKNNIIRSPDSNFLALNKSKSHTDVWHEKANVYLLVKLAHVSNVQRWDNHVKYAHYI